MQYHEILKFYHLLVLLTKQTQLPAKCTKKKGKALL